MWWLFCLILTSYYIANTANLANLSNLESPLQSVDDLASQTQIKYGMMKGGSTEEFFKNSNTSTYAKLWHYIEHTPAVFTKTTQEGIDNVLASNGQYAFFMESTTLEYALERYCNLRQVGGLLDTKSYGIAMPQNAPYRSAINRAILKLQEDGVLLELKQKWWSGDISCPKEEDSIAQMAPENVEGLFVILGVGIIIAFGVAVFEFIWNAKRVAREEGITYCEAVCDGLKLASSIWTNKKKTQSQ